VAAGVVALTGVASGAVRHEGQWPSTDKPVTLEVHGASRPDAVQKLAEAAGWSVVTRSLDGDAVDVHVRGQPAGKVLDLILGDGSYVARRDGDLVSIERDPSAAHAASTPSASPQVADAAPATVPPLAAPASSSAADDHAAPASTPRHRGEDRVLTGESFRVAKGDVVHDVVMFGGSVDVQGTVTGDVVITGGSVHVEPGGRVEGDVTAIGGTIDLDDGAVVEGDVGAVGGLVHRAGGAEVGGDVKRIHKGKPHGGINIKLDDDDDDAKEPARGPESKVGHAASAVGGALTRAALLFLFGTLCLGLAMPRMEMLQGEMAARPARSWALGTLAVLLASVLLIAMCVTVIGIPFALASGVIVALAAYVGVAAALTTVGGALLRHKTRNPYIHLAAGCVMLTIVGALPYVGWLATAAVALTGLGAIVATRGAGLFPARPKPDGAPYG
jgi:hypothetical protein